MTSRRQTQSLSPLLGHYMVWAMICAALLAGLFRLVVLDPLDPLHCRALMSLGRWLDDARLTWQPDGCMLHTYQSKDASLCLSSRRVMFIGDSFTRDLFFQFARIVDPTSPSTPPENSRKHSDYVFHSLSQVEMSFHWDPFLNSSDTYAAIGQNLTSSGHGGNDTVALLVLGSGLWYLRYSDVSGGLPAWEANIEKMLDTIGNATSRPTHEIVLLPVSKVVPSKLSHERAASMRPSDIEAMNSDLLHRLTPRSAGLLPLSWNLPPTTVSYPMVFNEMLDAAQTDDGLHYSPTIIKAQANVLLNSRCNDVLPKTYPLDKTCCRSYPRPSVVQFLVLASIILLGPLMWYWHRQPGAKFGGSIHPERVNLVMVPSVAIALIYLADRTWFWEKEQKQFNPWTFGFLSLAALGLGLSTVRRAEQDPGFLHRQQTDEWKGWMQIVILIYHYLGASKVSGIYNPIRVLVASYLFMTGYGHTAFYLRKADFSFPRLAQVMFRLNFFTMLLAYAMNTDYLFYYFSPLVSMWFLITYTTMAIGSRFNDRAAIVAAKILASAGIVTWFMSEPKLLSTLFEFLSTSCGIHWSAREWAFRVNLDLWIVYFGMLVALLVIKIREHRLTDHPFWPLATKIAIISSGFGIVWYFAFELLQESKFTYNTWHPYISFIPISAFIILRNANPILRSASSTAFAFIGRCSLETFIIQYHLWLAADTKGLLVVLPGARWRSLNFVFTTAIFIYVSHWVAQATGEITTWLCSSQAQDSLPTAVSHLTSSHRGEQNGTSIPLTTQTSEREHARKDSDAPEPDTPIRPTQRWVDRLATGSGDREQAESNSGAWRFGAKTKFMLALALMWVINMIWTHNSS